MKFCVTPTSEFRSTPNVAKFHFEGDTNNLLDTGKLLKILAQALKAKVTVKVFNTLES